MLAAIVKGFAGLAAIVALAVLLLVLPVTVVMQMERWLGPLVRGAYASMATAGVLAAIPFGFVFGLIPTTAAVWKALTVSIGAAVVMFLFVAGTGSVLTTYAQCCIGMASLSHCSGYCAAGIDSPPFCGLALSSVPRPLRPVHLLAPPFLYSPSLSCSDVDEAPDALQQIAMPKRTSRSSRCVMPEGFVPAVTKRQFTDLAPCALRAVPRRLELGRHPRQQSCLGRIALREGLRSKRFLLAAGNTPRLPQLNSFGPNDPGEGSARAGEQRRIGYFGSVAGSGRCGLKLDDWAKTPGPGRSRTGANLVY
jgi:hypothetical protein